MSFYEDYQKSLKKAANTKSNLFSALPKLKQEEESTVLKPYSNKNTRKVLKNSSEHKNLLNLPNYEEIKPRKVLTKQSSLDSGRIKTLIGNPNEKNEPVKLPNKIDPFNSEPKISKLPYKPYKPDSLNGNLGFGKLPDLNREGWEIDPKFSISGKGSNIDPKVSISGKGSNIDPGFSRIPNSKREGSRIKSNIQSIIKNRVGELDSRHIFDGIDDDTIERNKPVAQAAIEDNIRSGLLTQEQLRKYPNMLDAMTMFYAAGEKGKPKAQNLARSVAYIEGKYPDIIPTGINLMSNDVTAQDIESLRTSDNIVVQNNNASKRYVGADGVRIRNGYGLGATAMGLLNEGDEVEYTGRKTSEEVDGHYWAEIVHDGKTYWIAADYLKMEMVSGDDEHDEGAYEHSDQGTTFYNFNDNVSLKRSYVPWENKPFEIVARNGEAISPSSTIKFETEKFLDEYFIGKTETEFVLDAEFLKAFRSYLTEGVKNAKRPNNIGIGLWNKQVEYDLRWIDEVFGETSKFAKVFKSIPYISIGVDALKGVNDNINNDTGLEETLTDIVVDVGFGATEAALSAGATSFVTGALSGTAIGTAFPVVGNIIGAIAGAIVGIGMYFVTDVIEINDRSFKEMADDAIDWVVNGIKSWFS